MNVRGFGLVLVACVGAACAKSPIAPAGAITIVAPVPFFPPNGAQIATVAQPVTLTVRNGSATDPGASIVYTFEVAADRAFGFRIQTKEVVQTEGETSVRLDTLAAEQQYFWRVRATAGDTLGTFTEPVSFTVTPASALQLEAPTPKFPPSGSTVASTRPTLTIANSSRTGATGVVTYWFEIATDAAFANVVASGGVSEGATETSFTPGTNLSFKTTYYWHARAVDITNGAVSAFSTTATFVTVSGS